MQPRLVLSVIGLRRAVTPHEDQTSESEIMVRFILFKWGNSGRITLQITTFGMSLDTLTTSREMLRPRQHIRLKLNTTPQKRRSLIPLREKRTPLFCAQNQKGGDAMYFTSGSDRAFEHLMQGKPGFDHYDSGEAGAPEDCGDCRFYRPGWKYQFCVYAECPYQPGKLTAYDAVLFQVKGVDDEMAVFRVEKNRGYTVMSNHHLRNKDLSLKAKGLLSQMLSLPEDWDYTLKGLSLINRESIDAIRTAVWELEKARYITRQQNRDGRGKMADMVYTIYEQPQPRPEAAQGEQPGLENPVLENPTSDNPTSENPVSGNPMHMDGGLDSVNGIVDGLVVRLGCTLHIDGAVQMSRIVDAGKPAELLEQGRTLLLRDKVGGRHSVRQQLQFRQFKNTGTDEVAVLFAFHADNIVAGVQQELDISVHILPVGTDARILPISQNVRTGYEMGFIRLFIQQFQQQEQAALIIFLQRNSPIYSLGPDFRPQVQSYSATTSLNRMRMTAASARVAWPLGSKTPSPLPLTSPSALAHWRASRA